MRTFDTRKVEFVSLEEYRKLKAEKKLEYLGWDYINWFYLFLVKGERRQIGVCCTEKEL